VSVAPRPCAGAHWFLCGFSGSGKSTVGPLLARSAGRPFVDLDDAVAARVGASAPAWLTAKGEEAFREAELAALADVLGGARGLLVVALGGGALERAALAALVRGQGLLAWLDAPLATCLRRLAGDGAPRPVLEAARRAGGAEAVTLLHARRLAGYATADVRVPAGGSADETGAALLTALREREADPVARWGRGLS
jgi:shikimate kinase